MNTSLASITSAIQPLRVSLTNHAVYSKMSQLEHLQAFMQDHVFAVWDFMSLLKALQRQLTCVEVPWVPVGNGNTRYLINEIVNGEESDLDAEGKRLSHFEMYLEAMQQAGANTDAIQALIAELQAGKSLDEAFAQLNMASHVRDFVRFTFDVIATNQPHIIAAVFTFGREDLIPAMFIAMVKDLNASMPEKVAKFTYYLERHIEVDGDHHGHLALAMVQELCGNDAQKWQEATQYAYRALEMRQKLWDGVEASIANIALQEA